MSLKREVGFGLIWSGVEVAGTSVASFLVQLILARLLFPEEFGIVAIVAIFVNASQVCAQAGLGDALIQTKQVSRIDISTVFHLNLAVSVVATVLLWCLAPWVATWYERPILEPVLRALALVMPVTAIGESSYKLLMRNLDFRASAMASVPGILVGGMVGIVMAMLGHGVWSLVGQRIAQSIVTTATLLLVSPIKPRLEFSWPAARRLLPYGSGVASSQLVALIFDNLYVFVIGTKYSFTDLGYFTRAQSFQRFPMATLTQISNRVLFSVFSSIQDNVDRLRSGMRQALTMTVLPAFPLMTFMGVAAESIVLVLLTEKWLPSVPYMQLFAIFGALYPLHVINVNVMFAMGKSYLVFSLSLVKNALVIASILLTYSYGIAVLIWGMIVVSFLSIFVNAYYNKKLLGYSAMDQLTDVAPYALASAVAGTLAVLGERLCPLPPLGLLLVQLTIFSITYVLICHAFRLTAYVAAMDLWHKLRHPGGGLPTAKSAS